MSAIDPLPPLRAVIASHGLSARKSLGQNFLLDLNLTAKIARQAGDLTQCDVLEIGPGPGGLTRGLLAEGARKVLAIEKDARCIPALEEIAAAIPAGSRSSTATRSRSIRWRISHRPSGSPPTCPTTSAPSFWCAGSRPPTGRRSGKA